jgi:serine/threonine protein kinase
MGVSQYLDVNEEGLVVSVSCDTCAEIRPDMFLLCPDLVFFLSGIDYLHSSKPTVVHQSISADKVLLDDLCALRLADADLHKLLADDVVFSTLKYSTAMGYLAPEYAATGRFTDKVTCTHLAWSCSRCSLGAGAYRTSAASAWSPGGWTTSSTRALEAGSRGSWWRGSRASRCYATASC